MKKFIFLLFRKIFRNRYLHSFINRKYRFYRYLSRHGNIKALVIRSFLLFFLTCQDYPQYDAEEADSSDVFISGIELYCTESLQVGHNYEISAVLKFTDGTRSVLNPEDGVWTTSDEEVAVFNSPGVLSLLSEGRCSIEIAFRSYTHRKNVNAIDVSRIRLTEILYDAEGSDTDREFIVIKNNSSSYPVDVSAFYLKDGNSSSPVFKIPDKKILLPGEKLCICADSIIFHETYGVNADLEGLNFTLNNSGETVFLFDNNNCLVDCVYIEGGSSEYPEPLDYPFADLTASEGNSINYNFETGTWFSAVPPDSFEEN